MTYTKPQAEFYVSFHKNHLNVEWNLDYDRLSELEELMGEPQVFIWIKNDLLLIINNFLCIF